MRLDRLIIGLGNPGTAYEQTPHNVGFEVIDRLAQRHDAGFDVHCNARFASFTLTCPTEPPSPGDLGGESDASGRAADTEGLGVVGLAVGLAQPLTYMNRSGLAVRCLMEDFGVEPHHLLVVYDEVALPLGELRLRPKGSPGGHRGMESVVYNLRTAEIPRLRCGVGPCPEGTTLTDFVLAPFPPDVRGEAQQLTQRAALCTEAWCAVGTASAMNRFNGRPAASESESETLPRE